MYDPSSAFTHDDLFESSIELDDVPPVAINAEVIPDSVPASDNAIQHYRSDIPATESCGMTSVETDQNANPHRETPEDTTRPRESDIANAAPEEVTVQRSEPETRGQKEIVEPSTEIPSISRIKIEDLGTETIQDPLRAPTVGECSMEAAACRDENTGGDVFTAGKAVPSDAKSTVNEPVVEAASDDGNGNIAPDAIHRKWNCFNGRPPAFK